MPYFKDKTGGLHFLDSEDFEHLLPAGCMQITAAEAAAIQSPAPTIEQIKRALTDAVQSHLDAIAQAHGYDGILSLASYATSTNAKFSAEGKAGVQWRDDVWAYCWQTLADVEAGKCAIPTAEALIAELPAMVWP